MPPFIIVPAAAYASVDFSWFRQPLAAPDVLGRLGAVAKTVKCF
ncbi:Uncharacterised protein [Mycobacteroides abscessus subsp. abscessus]|nr:Uncharacterised protein [Mycobacteroides abscessus subsp. abscessus]